MQNTSSLHFSVIGLFNLYVGLKKYALQLYEMKTYGNIKIFANMTNLQIGPHLFLYELLKNIDHFL